MNLVCIWSLLLIIIIVDRFVTSEKDGIQDGRPVSNDIIIIYLF